MSRNMLSRKIQNALDKKGWGELTEPQKKAIPVVLSGENLLLIAPTGMGKTEAVMLPLFEKLLSDSHERIALLYITPLRALNRDMLSRLLWFAEELDIKVAVRHGDTPQKERTKMSKSPPDILITTPETFQILFTGKHLRKHLANVKYVVIDEVHELAQDERGAQLSVALERLCQLTEREVQRIGLSATVGNPNEIAKFLGGVGREVKIVKTSLPKDMEILVESPIPKEEDETLGMSLGTDSKQAACLRRAKELVEKHRSTLFFVNTRDTAERLATRYHLWESDFPVGVHHGSLSKGVRVQMEEDFKNEAIKALICTSSLELGIDVGTADFTIQYNSPRQVTRLVQRVGRAGHAIGETSSGTIIAISNDDVLESCAIARRALIGNIESFKIRENPLSVLANQILAIAVTSKDNTLKSCFSLVKKAYSFRNLEWKDFLEVVELLSDERVLWVEDDRFGRKRPSFSYFYDNLSMIPDERTFKVVDITTRKTIGNLDEGFTANYIQPHARIIIRGRPWEVVEFEEDVLVTPSELVGAVPDWVGEEIPVPYEVAQEVGRIRGIGELTDYPADDGAKKTFSDTLKSQRQHHPIPTDKLITIEHDKRTIVVNACLGSQVNETMGMLLSTLLAARVGESVGMRTDPYRIILDLPTPMDPNIVKRILMETEPEGVEDIIRMALRNSSYLRWSLINVAKKFCALEKEVDYKKISIKRLMTAFMDTPLYKETVDKTIWERMDIKKTKETLIGIQKREIELQVTGLSPIGFEGLEAYMRLVSPKKPDRVILMTLKRRLEDERIKLVCLNCKKTYIRRIERLPVKITCQNCGGKMVAAVPTYEDFGPVLKKKKPKDKEKKIIKKLFTNANLILGHGKKAILAMRARGVGPKTAARILSMHYETEEEFLREILSAEIIYARTRRFWD
ncbi:MAG: DEAD/DEAH box helicase [Thermoplasmata archaeon]|nr:MAG: DEAD/DEAH box helicase [Thermoplasmata archaeon]